jgi:hypothetical protein
MEARKEMKSFNILKLYKAIKKSPWLLLFLEAPDTFKI